MNTRRLLPCLLLLLFVVALAAVAPMLASCTAVGASEQPARAWVEASRAFHSTIGLKFKAYIVADPALDPATQQVYLRAVDDWDFMIRQGERLVSPAPELPAPEPAPVAAGGGS